MFIFHYILQTLIKLLEILDLKDKLKYLGKGFDFMDENVRLTELVMPKVTQLEDGPGSPNFAPQHLITKKTRFRDFSKNPRRSEIFENRIF